MNNFDYSFFNPTTGELLKKHWEFYETVINASLGKNKIKFAFLGGGVNGGKTYCCLITLLAIAENFPSCKIHIVRESMPTLVSTTVESLRKIVKDSGGWNKSSSNFFWEHKNGSRIYFFSENFNADKDLDRWKGLETNIIMLEQIEELQELTFQKSMERVGRWKDGNKVMPKPLILSTFNPTRIRWVREKTYLPFKSGNVNKNTYINMITNIDNPFTSAEEIEFYESMDSLHKKQYIEGSWDVFENVKSFLYSFDAKKHVDNIEQDKSDTVYVSFDFNVNPITCILANFDSLSNKLRVFKEIKLSNSNIHDICDEINKYKTKMGYVITGDANGNNSSIMIRENITAYDIIKKKLRVQDAKIKVPKKNLYHTDSSIVCNTALEHFDIKIDKSCESLIQDIIEVEMTNDGKIDKKNKNRTHLLDCFRYLIHLCFTDKVLKNKYN